MWELLEYSLIINMIVIHINYNHIVNALIESGSRLNPTFHKRGAYGVKVLYKPYVHDTTNF